MLVAVGKFGAAPRHQEATREKPRREHELSRTWAAFLVEAYRLLENTSSFRLKTATGFPKRAR